MSRPSLVVAVLVLALATVAVAGAVTQESAGAATPVVGTTPGEPNHLAINASAVEQFNTTTLDLDVGTAISADSSSLQASHIRYTFEAGYENATTDEARERVVERTRAQLEAATDRLEVRNRRNIQSYATGSIDAAAFLRERARITASAERFQGAITDVRNTLPRNMDSEFNGVNGRLEVLQGPISTRAVGTLLRGESTPSTYVEVSDSGYTLATITDDRYERETYLGDARRPNEPDRFALNGTSALTAAQDRAMELYPWVRTNQANISSAFGYGPGIYQVNRGFPGGELSVFLHGGSEEVFWEYQTRTLSSFNTTQPVNRTQADVRLTVNRTFATGPAEITIEDASTGTPLDGLVTIGDRDPVEVGADGRVWVVEPRGEVSLNATVGTTQFSTTLTGS